MKILFVLILLHLATACSIAGKKYNNESARIGELTDLDYADHLASLGASYLANGEVREVKLRQESVQFLDQTYERIVTNNALLLTPGLKPRFYFIENKMPFIFSLPHAQFYVSSSLLEKYLKSEELFVAALAEEILKSDRKIYEKKQVIPVGFYSTETMIKLTRARLEIKQQLNEWTYVILKRSGYDPTAFLNWIQIQNRNSLDFSFFIGDAVSISKEEHLFKNFMSREGVVGIDKKMSEGNSSKDFYKFLNNIVSNK